MTKYLAPFLFFSLFGANLNAAEKDKELHFKYSFVLSSVGYAVGRQAGLNKLESAAFGFTGALALGVLKELGDRKFDSKDLAYDVGGALIAPIIWTSF